ncbi:hypothetical protein GOP47_0018109 [Adiantum capillus-veneris]|uniref:protein-serine/threonine phosphatase n=1 Tax=Adiantum capillus-veneris TaxID=13818 RepID=A0A9D4UGP6_ADICA|nr:hypothetical protein GOP47_0018109 [Adiantum capillus-veneris]
MSQPSYKNILKRSRSSIDAAAGREDIIQGIALVCKASADNGDVLFSSSSSKERVRLEEVSEVAQVVSESSKLIDQAFFLPTLARSPSYPFDSNKERIRWLLAGRRESDCFQQHSGNTRRRKRATVHGLDSSVQSKDTDVGKLPSPALASTTSLNVEESAAAVNDESSKAPMHVHAVGDCISEGLSSPSSSHFQLPCTGAVNIVLSQMQEGAALEAEGHGLSPAAGPVKAQALEILHPPSRRSCCIARDRCPQFGRLSVCGCRREMEDTYTVEPDFVLLPCNSLGGCQCHDPALCACSSFHFFAVYDGHGGAQASTFCKARLHKALTEELIKDVRSHVKAGDGASSDWSLRWRRVMEACFLKIDEEVGGVCPTGGCTSADGTPSCCVNPIAPDNVGTTAVVAVIGPCQIIVANCGDSRAVLSRGGKVVSLSHDHKPDREDETNRIIAAGGRIIYWEGYRVGGLLAMSRAIGNRFLKNYVIAVPEVTCIERTKEDECLIIASDGLWDVVSSEMACDIARRRLRSQRRKCASADNLGHEDTPAGAAAALLTKFALSRGSKDNISVIVIDLKSYRKKSL